MMRILIDTNIYLDIALQRSPHAQCSLDVIKKIEEIGGEILLAPHSLATIYYLCEKELGQTHAQFLIQELLQLLTIGTFTHEEATGALKLGGKDFEDAMVMATAEANGADRIVTRNLSDFQDSPVTALTPDSFLADC